MKKSLAAVVVFFCVGLLASAGSARSVAAQSPTSTPTSTPVATSTPSNVVTVTERAIIDNPIVPIASVWAVLLLFVFVVMSGDSQKRMLAFLVVAGVAAPIIAVNIIWWSITVYFFFMLYSLYSVLRGLGGD